MALCSMRRGASSAATHRYDRGRIICGGLGPRGARGEAVLPPPMGERKNGHEARPPVAHESYRQAHGSTPQPRVELETTPGLRAQTL